MASLEQHPLNRRAALGVMGAAALSALAPYRAAAKPAAIDDSISPGSWSLAVLPDTQHYCRMWPQHFDAQTTWIAEHAKSHNIKYVLHEGDIVNTAADVHQWVNARKSLNILNGVVPYAIAPGNHDYGGQGANRETLFHDADKFGPGTPYASQPSVGGFFEEEKTDNSFHTFHDGKRDWLILTLEWGPRDVVVDWANKIVADHSDHLAILVTHAYMYYDDTRYDWHKKKGKQTWNPHDYGIAKLERASVNDGQQLWDKLVSQHKNFRFTFNGHVIGDGTGFLSSKGTGGNVVHQMLANYQFKHEGGDGDMRLVEFKDDGNSVVVRTYSPVLKRFDRDSDQQFAIKMDEPYDMPPSPNRPAPKAKKRPKAAKKKQPA